MKRKIKSKEKHQYQKHELLRLALKNAISKKIKFNYIIADKWYGSIENMLFINDEINKLFIFPTKENRLVKTVGEKNVYMNISKLNMKLNQQLTVYLKGLSFPVVLHCVAATNDSMQCNTFYLITNNLTATTNEIAMRYHKRWATEKLYRDLKQNTGIKKCPARSHQAQKNHIFLSFVAYCRLQSFEKNIISFDYSIKKSFITEINRFSLLIMDKLMQVIAKQKENLVPA